MPGIQQRRRARLVDVARLAGTSTPTASRVLNADPSLSVSDELRVRVRAAAEELGYRPHAAARALRRAQAGAVGMIIPTLANPVYAHIVRGAYNRARVRGSMLLLAEDADDLNANQACAELVMADRIDGLLVATAREGDSLIDMLGEYRTPHVFVNRGIPHSGRNVVLDEPAASAVAVDHLVSLGHRAIGHVAGPSDLDAPLRRARGFRERARHHGISVAPVFEHGLLEDGGAAGLDEMLDHAPSITAVYTATAAQGVGLLRRAWERGLSVPRDLSVIAHGEMPLAAHVVPPLTTIAVPYAALGASAVDALLDLLEGSEPRDVVVRTSPTVVVRSSTAPLSTGDRGSPAP